MEVFPAKGGPEITTESRVCATAQRNPAAGTVSDPRLTIVDSVSLRSWWKRIVADSLSDTGGIAPESRARPSSTRACTSGLRVSRWRCVAASSRSTAWRFSSSVVGASSVLRRPLESTYMTRSPSISISSMPLASNSSCRAPHGHLRQLVGELGDRPGERPFTDEPPVPGRLLHAPVGREDVQGRRHERPEHLAHELAPPVAAPGGAIQHHVDGPVLVHRPVPHDPVEQPGHTDRGRRADQHDLVGDREQQAGDAVAGQAVHRGHVLGPGPGVDDHLAADAGELRDHVGDLAGPDVRPVPRAGQAAEHLGPVAGQRGERLLEAAHPPLDGVDGVADVRDERQPHPLGQAGRHLVGVDQHGPLAAALAGHGQGERDLGGAAAAGHRQHDRDPAAARVPPLRRLAAWRQVVTELAGDPREGVVDDGRVGRAAGRRQVREEVHDPLGRGVVLDGGVDAGPPERLGRAVVAGRVHREHPATPPVQLADDARGEEARGVVDDQHRVVLLQRVLLGEDPPADDRAAVVGHVAEQVLGPPPAGDPDGDLDHGHP